MNNSITMSLKWTLVLEDSFDGSRQQFLHLIHLNIFLNGMVNRKILSAADTTNKCSDI